MPTDGGEADALVVRERTVSALAWSPEGDKLAFLAPDEPDEEDRRRERERDDAEVIGERWQVHRLWVIELSSRQVSRLGDFEGHLVALDWSPKGTVIAVVVRATPALDAAADSRICLVAADSADCGGGAVIELCVAPGAEDVCFAAGGDRVAFVACHEADQVSAITVWSAPAVAGCAAEVVGPTADEPACAVDVHAVDGEDRVVIKVLEGLDTRLEWCDTATGEREVLWRGSGDVAGYDVGPGPVWRRATTPRGDHSRSGRAGRTGYAASRTTTLYSPVSSSPRRRTSASPPPTAGSSTASSSARPVPATDRGPPWSSPTAARTAGPAGSSISVQVTGGNGWPPAATPC